MNEEQKQWIRDLQFMAANALTENEPEGYYESFVGKVQDHIDASPEP